MTTQAVQYSGIVIDGLGTPGRVTNWLALPDTATLAQTRAALDVWAAAVDGCIDGAFTQLYAVLTPPLPGTVKGPTGPTWAASNIGQTCDMSFSVTGTSARSGFALPSFSQSLIVNRKPNIADPNMVALIDLILNPTGYFTSDQQESLVAMLDAWLAFRQRFKQYQRSTVW